MAAVVLDDARRAARVASEHPDALVVSIGPARRAAEMTATIGISVRDRVLAKRLGRAMTRALRGAFAASVREIAALRVTSRKSVARVRQRAGSAIAVVPVTSRNLPHVGEIVESLRASGIAGVQLVWDGREPSRARAGARVFAVLEQARATPGQAPVVLARGEKPVEALRILVDLQRRQAVARIPRSQLSER